MHRVFIGIGSNIDRHIHIPQVLCELQELLSRMEISPVYQTSAVGFEGEDFYNLVDVYLDAVFFPKLSSYTLMQEGWRYELLDSKGPIDIKGVVYNPGLGRGNSKKLPLTTKKLSSDFESWAAAIKAKIN